MKTIKITIIVFLMFPFRLLADNGDSCAKASYHNAKRNIENMLSGKDDINYERAVYEMENAWYGAKLDYSAFTTAIEYHLNIIKSILSAYDTNKTFTADLLKTEEQKRVAYKKVLTNYAIFNYMTDTSYVIKDGSFRFRIYQSPFSYLHNDPLGTNDWKNTQVVNLLETTKGNCFSLASLFKIFADRLNSDAFLCTAPEHIYIRHADEKGTLYNVELGGRAFPGTGTLETLTYTSNEATKNGIALRQLTTKQTVALCLVYLAKGYEYKFNILDDDFMLSCADAALQYDDHCLNAMLLKAQILEKRLTTFQQPLKQLQSTIAFKDYEKWITYIFSLGYREMPFEMKNIIIKSWMKDTTVRLSMKDQKPNRYISPTLAPTRYASLSWGLFDEEMQTKRIERYGNTAFDTKTKKIISFLQSDILFNQYNFDPVVFALNVDPLAHKLPFASPYAFCLNSPISMSDPDGAYPIVTITKEVVGHTKLRVIGYTGVERSVYTNVNLYRVTVTDNEDKNFKMQFSVTRDAYAVKNGDAKNGVMKMVNVAFEPKDGNINHYTAVPMAGGYPKGNGTKALKLTQYGSEMMHAESNDASVELGYRSTDDVAKGIMMHVGGFYLHKDGTVTGAASEGCFGITNGQSSENDPANDYSNDILGRLINQADKSKKAPGKIEVIIQKRTGSEKPGDKTQTQE